MYFLLSFLCFVAVVTGSKDCNFPLGVSDGRIADDQMTASSHLKNHEPYYARLNRNLGARGWCSDLNDTKPWIKIALNGTYNVTAIGVQGRNHSKFAGWFVKTFGVFYADNTQFRKAGKYAGPNHKNDIAIAQVGNIVTSAIMIKLKHKQWHPTNGNACLRLEIYGCNATTTEPKVDYCAQNNTCTQRCVNGKTEAFCKCFPGFELGSDNRTCHDINECRIGADSCDKSTTTCQNTKGGYKCQCQNGLMPWTKYRCVDINECNRHNGGCNHKCTNLHGSYKCSCHMNFHLAADKHTCIDNNECTNGQSICNLNTTTCKNVPGTYRCPCLSGLKHGTFYNCIDNNECETRNGGCEDICTNTYGSYKCSCRKGMVLRDKIFCDDINECDLNLHNCEQKCRNQISSYFCDCFKGYKLNDDQRTCSDINECLANNGKGPCENKCQNTIGSYTCSCPKGYIVSGGTSCVDENECLTNRHTCDSTSSQCVNLQGSYECRCKPGFEKDSTGKCAVIKCPILYHMPNGYLYPKDCMTTRKSHNDKCYYKCNEGYETKVNASKYAVCNINGEWDNARGYRPYCDLVRCNPIPPVAGGIVYPAPCIENGVEYGEKCKVFCNSGYDLVGQNEATCQKDRTFDRNISLAKCVKRVKLQCPSDVTIVLPLGASETILPLSKLDIELDTTKLKSSPAGVLDGTYKFKSMFFSQAVKLIQTEISGYEQSCTFRVTVQDNEPPKILNCPTNDVFISIGGPSGVVTWPEPRFEDNVGVVKVINNMNNNQTLAQQVYYVFYGARDDYGNEAMCRFFVHVKGRYCEKSTLTGGTGGTKTFFGGGNVLNVFLACPPTKTFSTNMTGGPIWGCHQGVWGDVPDCVDFLPKNGACPRGYVTAVNQMMRKTTCAKCPKGTFASNTAAETCIECETGFYQDEEGQFSCKKCPVGTTSKQKRSKDQSACQALCRPGGYSPTGFFGSNGCVRCPEGSFQDLHGQKSCKLCPNGGVSHKGAKSEDECLLPARVSEILPSSLISAVEGDTITIKCYGTGSPSPYMTITNATNLAPANFRGVSLQRPLITGNKYISGISLTITGVTTYDTAIYKCQADNARGSTGALDERDIVIEVSRKV